MHGDRTWGTSVLTLFCVYVIVAHKGMPQDQTPL